jgi:hypothetical protein
MIPCSRYLSVHEGERTLTKSFQVQRCQSKRVLQGILALLGFRAMDNLAVLMSRGKAKNGTWTHHFHIVSNWIQNKCPVVMLMILWSQPGLAIAGSTSCYSCFVESIDSCAVCRRSVNEYITCCLRNQPITGSTLLGAEKAK